jgi:hypothetical protein
MNITKVNSVDFEDYKLRFEGVFHALSIVVSHGLDGKDNSIKELSSSLILTLESKSNLVDFLDIDIISNNQESLTKIHHFFFSIKSLDYEINQKLNSVFIASPSKTPAYLRFERALWSLNTQLCTLITELENDIINRASPASAKIIRIK